jgi:hypothetical protein
LLQLIYQDHHSYHSFKQLENLQQLKIKITKKFLMLLS